MQISVTDKGSKMNAQTIPQRLRPLLHITAVRLLLAAEFLVVLCYLAAALRVPVRYEFSVDEWQEIAVNSTLTTIPATGLRGVTEMTEGEDLFATPALTLPAGHYRITLDYFYKPSRMEDGSLCHANLHFVSDNMGVVSGENALLDHTKTQATVTLNVRQSDDAIRLVARNDSGIFQVGGVTIVQDGGYAWACVLAAALGALLLNALLLLLLPQSPLRLPGHLPGCLFVLGCVALLASIPLLRDGGGLTGADWSFHLSRIEGIANGLREGQFPVRLYSLGKGGYGYAPPLFYGELFLYFPAVLRLFGVSLQGAYHAFALAVQLATALIAFFSLRALLKNENAALLGSILYLLAPYRLTNFYMRAAVGEYLAMMLLPILPAALALLYANAPTRRDCRRAALLLTAVFGGLLQCHLITLELAVLATAVFCLWQWRKTFTRRRLAVWGSAVGLTVLLNLWFLVPFLTVMTTGQYQSVYTSDSYRVQAQGLSLPDLLLWQKDNITLGPALWLGAALLVYLLWTAGRAVPARLRKIGLAALGFGVAAACMTLTVFPWSRIGQLPVVGPLLIAIQFPWRYFSLASALLALAAGCAVSGLQAQGRRTVAAAAACLCCAVALFSTVSFFAQYLDATGESYLGGGATLQYANQKISNLPYYFDGLYLPGGALETRDGFEQTMSVTDVKVEAITQQNGVTTAQYRDETGAGGYLELPLLYYPGYKVIEGAGEVFQTVNGMVGLRLPAGSRSTVQVAFRGPLRWRLADGVSLVTALGLAVLTLRRKKKAAVKA